MASRKALVASADIGCGTMKHIIQFTVTKDEGVYTCACRKSNPDVLVMQTAQNGAGNDAANFRDSACDRRVLVQG